MQETGPGIKSLATQIHPVSAALQENGWVLYSLPISATKLSTLCIF